VGSNKIQRLFLRATAITDDSLAQLSGYLDLRELDLSGTSIGDDGLAAIARLEKIEALSLSRTEVSDSSENMLNSMNGLKKLDLRKTRVTAEAAERIQEALPDCDVSWSARPRRPDNLPGAPFDSDRRFGPGGQFRPGGQGGPPAGPPIRDRPPGGLPFE